MFIKLNHEENYRGKDYEEDDIIEVGDALGSNMILSGHKRSSAQEYAESKGKSFLTDEEIEALDEKDAKALFEKHKLEAKDGKLETLKKSLKSFFSKSEK